MLRKLIVLLLFAGLVVALLWFQGILFRHEPETTRVPEPQRLEAGARTAKVQWLDVGDERVLPGFVEPIDPAPVAARVLATVLSLDVREGDRVSAGQTLVTLDDRDVQTRLGQAEAGLAAADAQTVAARLGFERVNRLLDVEAATTSEWEAARAARDAAEAGVARARAGVEEARTALSWFTLTAPFDAVVLARHADPGQLAAPGQPLLELYRPDRLRLAVPVPAERAAGLAIGDEFRVAFAGAPEAGARLVRTLPGVDAQSGTVTLHLAPAELGDLRPGQLGRLRLATGERRALVVPTAAIEHIGQIERVALVRDGRVVLQTVRTGKSHAEVIEVLTGLVAGDEVVLP